MGIELIGYVNVTYIKTEAFDDDDDQDENVQRKEVSTEHKEQLDATDFFLESGGESERDKEDGTWSCEAFFKAFGEGYEVTYTLSFVGDQPHVKKLDGQSTEDRISEVRVEGFLTATHEVPEEDAA